MLEVFTIQNRCAGKSRGMHDHRIPKRDVRQPMQFDGCNYVVGFKAYDASTSEKRNLALGKLRVDRQFPRDKR